MKTVYLSLGTNLGDRKINLRRALKLIQKFVTIEKISPVYETDPLYFPDQPVFYNLILRGTTKLSPSDLLTAAKSVEKEMGREGATHNRPRIIDVDIITYGDEVIDMVDLQIPHKRIPERAFVLVPLRDIAPKFIHPVTKETIAQMLERIPEASKIVRKTKVTV